MDKDFLWKILSSPTAPFRESHVAKTLCEELSKHKIPHFSDPKGNIIVGASSKTEYRTKVRGATEREPLRIFMAHMDHPGFHGEEWISDDRLKILWHGGSPDRHIDGAGVWISNSDGTLSAEGEIETAEMRDGGRFIQSAIVKVSAHGLNQVDPRSLYGGFRFRSKVWEENGRIYTHAADDLIGCFSIVSLARELWTKKSSMRKRFLGLLTRAEEVGFIGAIAHFRLGWLLPASPKTAIFSLETSRTLPGAEFGKGPIVRLGDRATPFEPGLTQVLTEAAERALPGKHQRRIMDGGTCEATAATVFGLRATGISIPLGNYHNQSFEGGPDSRGPSGPAPEFVELSDISGMITLCTELMKPKLSWEKPWASKAKKFQESETKYKKLLSLPV